MLVASRQKCLEKIHVFFSNFALKTHHILRIAFILRQLVGRYNCNRYDEEEAKRARDAQEVYTVICFSYTVLSKVW